ncbi:hypothetical protein D3C78_1682120 [compost metagenome]
MGSRDLGTGAIAEQGRQAVGGQHRAGDAGFGGPAGVGLVHAARVGLRHAHTMHLAQPGGATTQGRRQQSAILFNGLWIVLDMAAEVQAFIWRQAEAPLTGGDAGLHPLRSRPIGRQPDAHCSKDSRS